jgi:hypothetical protein
MCLLLPQIASDDMRAKMSPPLEPLPLVEYMFQHLAGERKRGIQGAQRLLWVCCREQQHASEITQPK